MHSLWTRGLDEQVAKDIKGDFKSSLLIRKRLSKILDDKYDEFERSSVNATNYGSPNWALTQADLVGFKRALRMVQSYILEEIKE